jgi:hypothetical protein
MDRSSVLCCVTLFALLGGVAPVTRAETIQDVFVVNTSSLAGTAGAVDVSFDPGRPSATQLATATLTQFTGAAIDSAHSASDSGSVSGALPGPLQFTNSKQLNDVFTPVIFGSAFDFLLTLSGPAVNSPDPNVTYGSVFVLALFSSNGTAPLMTKDGIIATLQLAPGRTTTTPEVFTTNASITAVPEPSTAALLTGALLVLFVRRRGSLRAKNN